MTGNTISIEKSPLKDLKALMLEIEWEIDEKSMEALIDHAETLCVTCRDDRIARLFLKLLVSVAKYIQSKKATAHPDAVHLLHSVFNALEYLFFSSGIPEEEKKKMLLSQVDEFKRLKEQIARRTSFNHGKKEEMQNVTADMGQMTGQQAFACMLEEIRKIIRAEFEALRSELRS